jgi:hypothetical protein
MAKQVPYTKPVLAGDPDLTSSYEVTFTATKREGGQRVSSVQRVSLTRGYSSFDSIPAILGIRFDLENVDITKIEKVEK